MNILQAGRKILPTWQALTSKPDNGGGGRGEAFITRLCYFSKMSNKNIFSCVLQCAIKFFKNKMSKRSHKTVGMKVFLTIVAC
jgi:hypothetical protein